MFAKSTIALVSSLALAIILTSPFGCAHVQKNHELQTREKSNASETQDMLKAKETATKPEIINPSFVW